ncbi:N-acetyltransferase [Candidatus Thorarchaeota archaeon]|nr:MAG: N-acetyltransferase [Candidatus Thorarchaeota archaeon]
MIDGKKIRLVLLEDHHLDDIMRGWNNPVMRKFLGGFIPNTKEAEREWIQSAQLQMKNRSSYYFVIEDVSTSRFIGTVSLNAIDWLSKSSGMGIAIHDPQDWEKGYGTEAMQLVIDFGWQHLNLRRIELSVYSFNPRARYVYEKLGFKEWGVAHKKFFVDGEYHDAHYMEIFRENE